MVKSQFTFSIRANPSTKMYIRSTLHLFNIKLGYTKRGQFESTLTTNENAVFCYFDQSDGRILSEWKSEDEG